jgi:homoaconitase/3-isopropylmalate dehydratase large subunit
MGKTIAEKILGRHAGHEVKAGDFVLANVDVMMGNAPLGLRGLTKNRGIYGSVSQEDRYGAGPLLPEPQ